MECLRSDIATVICDCQRWLVSSVNWPLGTEVYYLKLDLFIIFFKICKEKINEKKNFWNQTDKVGCHFEFKFDCLVVNLYVNKHFLL